MSKSEIENLYYAVVEENQALKRTMNSQNEKIKMLTTKMLRTAMAQKSALSKDQNRCCASSHAVICEQKEWYIKTIWLIIY